MNAIKLGNEVVVVKGKVGDEVTVVNGRYRYLTGEIVRITDECFFIKLKDGKIVRKKQTNVALVVDVNGAVKKEKEEKEKVERTNEMLLEEVSHQRKQMAAMQREVATLAAKLDALTAKLAVVKLD
jgi:hypothetical protein